MPSTTLLAPTDCRPLLDGPEDLALVFSPVADLAAASVAGWTALPRFPGTAPSSFWNTAAAEAGLADRLAALQLARALEAVPALPAGAHLTVPVEPRLLTSGAVRSVLDAADDLHGVVLELTGPASAAELPVLAQRTAELRARGALLAVGDPLLGCPDLAQLVALRPDLVTVDRALVVEDGTDPVRAALFDAVAGYAARTGARLLATGLSDGADVAAAVRRGVALGRGWALGRPDDGFAPLTPAVADQLRAQAMRLRLADSVAGLLRPARQVTAAALDGPDGGPAVAPAVVTDDDDRPAELLLSDPRTGETHRAPVTLAVPLAAGVHGTLQQALARAPRYRFDPVLVTDPSGAALGLVRVDDLASAATAR